MCGGGGSVHICLYGYVCSKFSSQSECNFHPCAHTHTAVVSEAKDDQELVSSLSERMYYNMRERLEKDPDFKPERFPNAQNFYEPRK